ncbi:hypothetical protein [Microbulbifer sp. PAAF003]|uniref:hypothetical protein n=1 Tax=Microbulbifer sp. PAAF003 TaxID=3243375 RepID=UPI004039105B
MPKQIGIAQSMVDEEAFIDRFNRLGDFMCLPRMMEEEFVEPCVLGGCQDQQQVIFLKKFFPVVMSNIKKVEGKELFHVLPREGLCIEWIRTSWNSIDNCVPGRLFYDEDGSSGPDSTKQLSKTFNQIRMWIEKDAPFRTDARFSVYVGSDLSKKLESKKARVLYRGGGDLELVNNEKWNNKKDTHK